MSFYPSYQRGRYQNRDQGNFPGGSNYSDSRFSRPNQPAYNQYESRDDVPPSAPQQSEQSMTPFEQMMIEFMAGEKATMESMKTELLNMTLTVEQDQTNQQASIQYLERKMDRILNEHVDVFTAQSGTVLNSPYNMPNDSNLVFQDESDDDTDEEEEVDEVVNHLYATSEAVLQDVEAASSPVISSTEDEFKPRTSQDVVQELHMIELEETGDSDWDESDVEEEEEIAVDEASKHYFSNHETYFSVDIIDAGLDDELHVLLGLDEKELNRLKNGDHGMMTEAELLESMELSEEEILPLSMDEFPPPGESYEELKDDDRMRIITSHTDSMTDSQFNFLSCINMFVLIEAPKQLDHLSKFLTELVSVCTIDTLNTVHGRTGKLLDPDELAGWNLNLIGFMPVMERGTKRKCPPDKCMSINSCYSLEDDPGDPRIAIPRSSSRVCDVPIMTFTRGESYRNFLTIDDFLPCEYDWKGGGSLLLDPT